MRSSVSCTDSVPFEFMPEDDSYHVVNIVKGLCTAEWNCLSFFKL